MKKILHDIYLHKSAVDSLPEPSRNLVKLSLNLTRLRPDVIRISELASIEGPYHVMYAWCDDFDGNPEPSILKTQTWRIEHNTAILVKERESKNGNPQVYHAKELMVGPGYGGFDAGKAEARRKAYLKLKPDTRRMGYRKWWDAWRKGTNTSLIGAADEVLGV